MSEYNQQAPVITLDGPSGTGKGTISLMLARHLNWNYLDSGALYRVLAFAASEQGINIRDNASGLAELARSLNVSFDVGKNTDVIVYLDNKDISQAIRSETCGQQASIVAAISEVRQALLERQRNFALSPGLVTDGRDMGTVVFPQADLKIYLDATAEQRALRRYNQLKEKGIDVSLADIVDELTKRDERDTRRAHSPLKPAADAFIIDTTRLDIVQTFDHVLQLAKKEHIIPN